MDCNLLGSSVHGISQARIQEWIATSFSRRSSWPWDGTHISCIDRQFLYHWASGEDQYHSLKLWITQSCLTLCDPMICSLPGSSVHRIFQARILEWVAMLFSMGWEPSWCRDRTQVSCIAGRFITIWTTRDSPLTWSLFSCRKQKVSETLGFWHIRASQRFQLSAVKSSKLPGGIY